MRLRYEPARFIDLHKPTRACRVFVLPALQTGVFPNNEVVVEGLRLSTQVLSCSHRATWCWNDQIRVVPFLKAAHFTGSQMTHERRCMPRPQKGTAWDSPGTPTENFAYRACGNTWISKAPIRPIPPPAPRTSSSSASHSCTSDFPPLEPPPYEGG